VVWDVSVFGGVVEKLVDASFTERHHNKLRRQQQPGITPTRLVRRAPGGKYVSFDKIDKHYSKEDVYFKVKVRPSSGSSAGSSSGSSSGGEHAPGKGMKKGAGSGDGGGGGKKGQEEGSQGAEKGKKKGKSFGRRVSHGIKKYPFLSLAAVTSMAIGLNTYAVVAGIRSKEDKVMKLKMEKGELPVAILPPAPTVAPDPDLVKPKKSLSAAAQEELQREAQLKEQAPTKEGAPIATEAATGGDASKASSARDQ
jgi:hypothetical protein